MSFVLRSCKFKCGGEEGLIERVSSEQRLTSEGQAMRISEGNVF